MSREPRIDVLMKKLLRVVEVSLGATDAARDAVQELNEAERDLVTETVVEQTRGRVPVIVNTGAASTSLAVFYSKRAEDLGADAVMVTPPVGLAAPGPDETRAYYHALSEALMSRIVNGDAIPEPSSAARDQHRIAPDPTVALKAMLPRTAVTRPRCR